MTINFTVYAFVYKFAINANGARVCTCMPYLSLRSIQVFVTVFLQISPTFNHTYSLADARIPHYTSRTDMRECVHCACARN